VSSELKVGLFTAVALAILAYMIIKTGSCGIWFGEQEGFRATAMFRSIAGLEKKAAVRIAGVRVGEVSDVSLNPNGIAEVRLLITEPIQLRKGTTAAVSSLGLMGEKYVEIFPGQADEPELREGAIIQGKEPLSIDQMGAQVLSISNDIKGLTSALSSALGSTEGQAKIKSIVNNFAEFAEQLQAMITENRATVRELLKSGTGLTTDVKTDLKRIVTQTEKLLDGVNTMIEENRGNIHSSTTEIATLTKKLQATTDSLNSILRKIDEGDGTLGKLVNEPTTHDKLNKVLDQMDSSLKDVSSAVGKVGGMSGPKMGLRTEYHVDSERAKTYLSLGMNLKKNRYFLLELAHDPIHVDVEETTIEGAKGSQTVRTETIKQNISFTVEGGLRFGPVGFRGGFMESTAGIGIDLGRPQDRLTIALDGYDFGRDAQPHLKAAARLGLHKDFYLTIGGDELLRDDDRQLFVGVGIGTK